MIYTGESRNENVGETGCLEPAFKQKTNDDESRTVKS